MDIPISTDTWLFNDLFLRSILLIPLALSIYVLITVYKQHDTKFRNINLIQETIHDNTDQESNESSANR